MIRRPIFRYPGGKFTLAKWVISHFPGHETYVELFGGAASVLLQKQRSQGEVYNDINGDVVNVFRILRNDEMARKLTSKLLLTPFSYDEYKAAFDPTEDPIEKARQMIFRSYAGIGSDSLFRPNAGYRGLVNRQSGVTPATPWAEFPHEISKFVERLRGVSIENRDATRLIKLYDRPRTLFYVDPPYVMSTRSSKSVMYENEYSDQQHRDLAAALRNITGMAIVSGYTCELYDEIYSGWRQVLRNHKAQNGKPRVECLWLSPNIQTMLF